MSTEYGVSTPARWRQGEMGEGVQWIAREEREMRDPHPVVIITDRWHDFSIPATPEVWEAYCEFVRRFQRENPGHEITIHESTSTHPIKVHDESIVYVDVATNQDLNLIMCASGVPRIELFEVTA